MNIKHNKLRNTGILFELLVRQITADTLSGFESKAVNILKKYFTKTELGREYKLYELLNKNNRLTESKSNMIISTIIETSKQLNKSVLKRQKYNLIKEIGDNYNLEDFFKTKIPNYKVYASLYTLLEIYSEEKTINPEYVILNKVNILEHLTSSKISEKEVKDNVFEELKHQDKDVRILTYKILLEKFNSKYIDLNLNQKLILKEYINSVDNTPKLKEFYNTKISDIKRNIIVLAEKVTDKATQIKLKEIPNLLTELGKNQQIDNKDILNLLQYYELIEELNNIHGTSEKVN
jgi:hypothetical protein